MPTPISLLIDDSCPLIHVYRYHWEAVNGHAPFTEDGRPLPDSIPNAFLDRFADVCDEHGLAGKLSIVPSPARKGDIVTGIEGFDPALTRDWLETLNRRLAARFDFSPEGVTHNLAVDLSTGHDLPLSENDWSQTQTRETLTPYLIAQLDMVKRAGVTATGVTSPWSFGEQVEPEYLAAIMAAQWEVNRRDFSWFFLHFWPDRLDSRPYVAAREDGRTLVSIPGNVDDLFWATINTPRADDALISSLADGALTEDGRGGAIPRILAAGGWPILVTHWQSLWSCGLETGLRTLGEVGRRVSTTLGDTVRWTTCMELARAVVK